MIGCMCMLVLVGGEERKGRGELGVYMLDSKPKSAVLLAEW